MVAAVWNPTYNDLICAALDSQSLVAGMSINGAGPGGAHVNYLIPSTYPPASNKRVCFVNRAQSNSSMSQVTGVVVYWHNTDGTRSAVLEAAIANIQSCLSGSKLAATDLKYIVINIGNTDAGYVYNNTLPIATFKSLFIADLDYLKTLFPAVTFLIQPLTKDGAANVNISAGWRSITQAFLELIRDRSDCKYWFDGYDIEQHDFVHYTTPAGWTLAGNRAGKRIVRLSNGDEKYGPVVSAVSGWGTSALIITVTHDEGTDLVLPNGDPKNMFKVFDSTGSVAISSAVRLNATQIQLNLSAPLNGVSESLDVAMDAMPNLTTNAEVVRDNAANYLPLRKTVWNASGFVC